MAEATTGIDRPLHYKVSSAKGSTLVGGSWLNVRQESSSIQARSAGIRDLRLNMFYLFIYLFIFLLFIYLAFGSNRKSSKWHTVTAKEVKETYQFDHLYSKKKIYFYSKNF